VRCSLSAAILSCARDLIDAGEAVRALQLLQDSSDVIGEGSEETRLRAQILRIDALVSTYKVDDALQEIRRLLASEADLAAYQDHLAAAKILEGRSLWYLNRVDEAIEKLLAVRQQLLSGPDSILLAACLAHLSSAALVKGDVRLSRALCLEALVSARRCGSRKHETHALGNLGILERRVCRWNSAFEAITELGISANWRLPTSALRSRTGSEETSRPQLASPVKE
jgi:hypothetical protein